jgi:hypothetical protein
MLAKKVALAVAAVSMVPASAAIAAPITVNPAAKLSIAPQVRAPSHGGKSKLVGTALIAVIGVAAIAAGAIIVATSDNDDNSASS